MLSIGVSLLVRLWVEMLRKIVREETAGSASLWGCELKYAAEKSGGVEDLVSLLVRLWVEIALPASWETICRVSLLVRLWVEMTRSYSQHTSCSSASLWGCELKCGTLANSIQTIIVSLLVRLWVEIKNRLTTDNLYVVSLLVRLWVEILDVIHEEMTRVGQPPCEAVSWNRREQWEAD